MRAFPALFDLIRRFLIVWNGRGSMARRRIGLQIGSPKTCVSFCPGVSIIVLFDL